MLHHSCKMMDWIMSFRSLLPRQPGAPMPPKMKGGHRDCSRQLYPPAKRQRQLSRSRMQEHYELLAICFNSASLELKDLAVISTCSKVCRQQVQLYLQQNMTLLLNAVKQASLLQLPHSSVKWFCSMAGLEAVQSQQDALVNMANVISAAAAHILDAGLQISYSQLMSAARQRVPGVEVWVRSHFSGLPTIVEALCTHNAMEFQQLLPTLQPQDIADCLYLATNIKPSPLYSYPKCATLLLEHIMADPQAALQLQYSVTAADLEHLLTTAVVRRHDFAHLRRLFTLPAANALGAAAVTALLQLAVSGRHYLAVRLLSLLQAAQHVTSEAASRLVLTAVQGRDASTLTELREHLSATSNLSRADVAGLLWAALPLSSAVGVCIGLCAFPAANSITPSVLAAMMKAAMVQQKSTVVDALCRRHTAAAIPAAAVSELILHSLQVAGTRDFGTSTNGCTHALCELQGAQLLQPSAVGELLQAAMRSRDEDTAAEVVSQLCQLPGAHGLDAASVASLLKVAVHVSDVEVLIEICGLPAAAEMQQSDIVGILELCLQLKHRYKLLLLLGHEAAQRLNAAAVASLLVTATQVHQHMGFCACGATQCGSSFLERICELPATQQVTAAAAAGLLKVAIQLEDGKALQTLCDKLPAVKALDSEAVTRLLQGVVDKGGRLGTAADVLCSVPGACELDVGVVSGLLDVAEQQSSACVRSSLYTLLMARKQAQRQ